MGGSDTRSYFAGYGNKNYYVLLGSLLVMLAFSPFSKAGLIAFWIYQLAQWLVTFSALFACWLHRRVFVIALVVGIATHIADTAGILQQAEVAATAAAMLRIAFLILIVYAVFGDILKHKRVTMNTVAGAIGVYILLGMIWWSAYQALEINYPGSFTLGSNEPTAWGEKFGMMDVEGKLLYFSLITLTTVGYGDFAPLAPPARYLAALEALIGPLYLAVIIARFVAMEMSSGFRNDS